MTGYTVHTGSNDKFSKGWDNIFQGGKKATKAAVAKEETAKSSKKAAKKSKKSAKK